MPLHDRQPLALNRRHKETILAVTSRPGTQPPQVGQLGVP